MSSQRPAYHDERTARILNRLTAAERIQRQARTEADRMLHLAWRAGIDDHTIAQVLGVTVETARRYRNRAGRG